MSKHLSQEQLLRHLDGELSQFAAWQAAAHLKTCWACQVEFDHLKEQIAAIVDAHSAVFDPSLPPPPGPWARLEPRLEQVRIGHVPSWKKLVPFAGRSLGINWAYGGAALAAALIGLSLWVSPMPVSAKEVLTRVTAAEGKRLAITARQVVRQRVRVSKTSGASSAKQARVDSWKSPKSMYWDSDDLIGVELLARYESVGLKSALPLSPAAIETWVKVAGSEPSATRNHGLIGVDVVSNAAGQARGLDRVSLQVRAGDWHLEEMTLAFTDATYQIAEEEFSVIARDEIPRDVMAHLEQPQPPSTPVPESQNIARNMDSPVNLDDLEMGVRFDLHQIGADLGEAIEIVPQRPGHVRVEAHQVSPEIREKLVTLLGDKVGVRLEFQGPGGAAPSPGGTRIIPQAGGSRAPVDPRVAAFFGSAEAQENYTQTVLETSNTLLAHLHALRELAVRWPKDQERGLSANAKANLEAMVRDHAREVVKATSGMQKQLAPFMEHLGVPMTDATPVQTGVSWREASDSGLDAARRVDGPLRSLLTASDSPLSPEQALPRIRQSLGDLQRAANQL